MDTKKHAIIIDLLSVLTLGIPGIHFFLFKYLFVRKTIFTYGSLKALHAEDGWRGFMIIEDIEPYMLCFFIISAIICLIVSYFVFRNHEGKASRAIALLPIAAIIIMLFLQYITEPGWVAELVDYRSV